MKQKYTKEAVAISDSIGYNITMGYNMNELHWHPYYELQFITKSDGYSIINSGNVHNGESPEIILHRPYSPHRIIMHTNVEYERYIVYVFKSTLSLFSDRLIDISALSNFCMLVRRLEPQECAEYIELCRAIERSSNDFGETALLCALLLRRLISSSGNIVYSSNAEYITDVLQYIDDNLAERVTVEDICSRFGVGHTKLEADISHFTGMTLKRFLTMLRMNRARVMLEMGNSVMRVSLDTGYSSEAHFIKVFKQYYGITPGELLKRVSGGQT